MNRSTRKILCGILAVLMVLAILPVASLAEAAAERYTEYKSAQRWDSVWDYLDAVESEMLAKNATPDEVTMAVYRAALNCPLIDEGAVERRPVNGHGDLS